MGVGEREREKQLRQMEGSYWFLRHPYVALLGDIHVHGSRNFHLNGISFFPAATLSPFWPPCDPFLIAGKVFQCWNPSGGGDKPKPSTIISRSYPQPRSLIIFQKGGWFESALITPSSAHFQRRRILSR